MNATWYRACCGEITPVEVEREAKSQIVIAGRRCAKQTSWEAYFPTEEEAVTHIIETADAKVEAAENALLQASTERERIKQVYGR